MKVGGILLAAFLGIASAADIVPITLKIKGEDTTILYAELDELARTHRYATKGLSASVDKKGVYCQAFSDPNGRDALRAPFSAEDDDVIFTKNPDGLSLGSFLCSDSIDKLDAPGMRPMEGDSTVDGDNDDDGEDSVVLQFRTDFQSFTRGTVPVGKIYSLEDSDLGNSVLEAFVVSVKGGDLEDGECQLYKDSDGKKAIGKPFSIYPKTFGTEAVTAGAVKCKINKK